MPKKPLGLPPRKARWFSLTDEEFAQIEPILKEIYRIRPRAGGTRSPEERAQKDWEKNIRKQQAEEAERLRILAGTPTKPTRSRKTRKRGSVA